MTVILVAHILVSLVLVVVVLMQRSEGGGLGIGGGGGGGGAGGGLMTGRGVAGALVRTTIIFGAIFFVTSLGLTTMATKNDRGGITELEEGLNEDFGVDPADDGLGFEGLDPVLDLNLSDDPLAAVPSVPATQPVPEQETPVDPLADPLADPQE